MSANLTESAGLKNIATIGSARRLVRSAARELSARESTITVPSASVQRTTSARLSPSADQSATETLTVPDQSQLATTESARILVMAHVAPTLTATSVG
jgi:hypothetical protein